MTRSSLQVMPACPINMNAININSNASNDITNNNNNNINRINMITQSTLSSPRRCLFGVPDSNDLRRIVKEQQEEDRQRFRVEYHFDIITQEIIDPSKIINKLEQPDVAIKTIIIKDCNPEKLKSENKNKNSVNNQQNLTQKDKRYIPYSVRKNIPDSFDSTKKTKRTM